ncbi:MAG TPA: hypothetical protein VGB55_07475, partial [Tepidisphaeraceae bacterium]
SLLAVIASYLVLVAADIKAGTTACRVVNNPVLASFGKYSYGLYVTHLLFGTVFAKLFPWDGLRAITGAYWSAIVINCVLSIACSWVIAWISFHAMEKHFLRLKSFFDYRRPVAQPAPALARPSRLSTAVARSVRQVA